MTRVLIVEDEKKVAAFVQQALREEGYGADVAGDGQEGLDQFRQAEYDLVILDWRLPGPDGMAVCAALRQAGYAPPILMLTARDSVADRVTGLDAGADDYLTKPFALSELLARVRALLRRNASLAAPVLKVADLTLDLATRSVQRGQRTVDLSPKEFALLEYLMRHAGRPLNRALIAEHVWGFDFDSGTNVVDVYINYLRNKIERAGEAKLIRTVRGVGYCLDDPGAARDS